MGANMNVEGLINRLKWNGENGQKVAEKEKTIDLSSNRKMTPFIKDINSMKIRTFRLNYFRIY